jgi:TRAP-type C4-dicarboxylate transport system substrate-binding protein
MTLKPLPSINDLKNLKIRAAGDTAKIVTAMGAIAVSVPMGDIYEGLQRGVVEGVIFPAEALKGWRFGDLIRGLQDNDGLGYPSAQCLVMNKGKWNSLPADIQKIFEKVSEEYIEKQGRLWDETTKEGIEFGVSKGMKVFKISPEEVAITREKMKPVLADYVKRMKDKGLPGEESLKFLQDFIKSHPS